MTILFCKIRLAILWEKNKRTFKKEAVINLISVMFFTVILLSIAVLKHEKIQSSRYKGVFDDNFSYFSSKPYVVTPHLNRLIETVQIRGHDMFLCRINKKYT